MTKTEELKKEILTTKHGKWLLIGLGIGIFIIIFIKLILIVAVVGLIAYLIYKKKQGEK